MSDLRRRIIRLAAEAEPALKKDLLSILKDQADPASHDQNLPATYYGLPPKGKVAASGGWKEVFQSLDADFKSYNTTTVTAWNKVYNRMKKEGVKDAGAAAHFYHEYRAGRMDIDQAAEALSAEGVKPPATGKTAASGPATDGKNWKERSDSKGAVRHIWTAPSNSDSAIDSFTVFEKVGLKGEKSFTMNVLMSDGEIYKRSGPEDIGRLFAMAARLFESAATPGFDLGAQPGWTKV